MKVFFFFSPLFLVVFFLLFLLFCTSTSLVSPRLQTSPNFTAVLVVGDGDHSIIFSYFWPPPTTPHHPSPSPVLILFLPAPSFTQISLKSSNSGWPFVMPTAIIPRVSVLGSSTFDSTSSKQRTIWTTEPSLQLSISTKNLFLLTKPLFPPFFFFFLLLYSEDMYAQDSIDLLRRSGIDFKRHGENGIDVSHFGELLMSSGIVLNDEVKWITFHSG